MQEPKSVRISIFGEQYMIKGLSSPEAVHKIASLVDEMMKEIAGKHPALDHHKLAVLAALNIAYRLHVLEQDSSERQKAYDRQVQALEALNDRLMKLEKDEVAREALVQSLKSQLQQLEEERTRLNEEKERLEKTMSTLNLELERLKAAYQGAQEEIRELYGLLDETTTQSS